jgi:hypothetical protein
VVSYRLAKASPLTVTCGFTIFCCACLSAVASLIADSFAAFAVALEAAGDELAWRWRRRATPRRAGRWLSILGVRIPVRSSASSHANDKHLTKRGRGPCCACIRDAGSRQGPNCGRTEGAVRGCGAVPAGRCDQRPAHGSRRGRSQAQQPPSGAGLGSFGPEPSSLRAGHGIGCRPQRGHKACGPPIALVGLGLASRATAVGADASPRRSAAGLGDRELAQLLRAHSHMTEPPSGP